MGTVNWASVAAGSGGVSVLLGDGIGAFNAAIPYAAPNSESVTVSDLNGDSKLDVVVADLFGSVAGYIGSVYLLLGDGIGGLSAAASYAAARLPNAVTTVDFNGDGKLDLIAADNGFGTVCVLLEDGFGRGLDATSVATSPGSDTEIVVDTIAPAVTVALVTDARLRV